MPFLISSLASIFTGKMKWVSYLILSVIAILSLLIILNGSAVMEKLGFETREVLKENLVKSKENTEKAIEANKSLEALIEKKEQSTQLKLETLTTLNNTETKINNKRNLEKEQFAINTDTLKKTSVTPTCANHLVCLSKDVDKKHANLEYDLIYNALTTNASVEK